MKKYILFNKPYNVLCQFTPAEGKHTLAEFGFPKNVYSVGRLDYDSEGSLLLTDDGEFHLRLIAPEFMHERTYFAQVEIIPTEESIQKLRKGVMIEGEKTLPALVELVQDELKFPERSVPIRYRKSIPTSWLKIIIYEGRNRQVRKMTASLGYPTLRLIRTGILFLTIGNVSSGTWRLLTNNEIKEMKKELKLSDK
ncbi:MAG: pseudouridine synthase [Bacteroidota bacterium]